MKTIKGLSVRHIRGARRVDIHTPDKAMVEISGGNGSGKSSTLDAIEWGIRGKRALPEDPLHHGATSGQVKVDLGDLTITRRITEANAARGGTVVIQAADGSKWGQRDLEQLYGAWTFDPAAFAGLKPEQQASQIRALAGPEFCGELSSLDAALADAEAARTEAGREVKRFGALPSVPRADPVDTAELADRLRQARAVDQKIQDHVRSVEAQRGACNLLAGEVAQRDKAVGRAQAALDEAREMRGRAVERQGAAVDLLRKLEATAEALPDPVDIQAIEQEMAEAGARNAEHAAWKANQEKLAEWQQATRKHEQLQADVEDLREKRIQHLRTAKLPVDGLSWEGGKIALHGTPFRGLSTTEQLLLSARIGMAMSPDLRVMLVREGGLIDRERFSALRDLAAAEGYQIWMETAGDGHTPDALVIEAGELSDTADRRPDDWAE